MCAACCLPEIYDQSPFSFTLPTHFLNAAQHSTWIKRRATKKNASSRFAPCDYDLPNVHRLRLQQSSIERIDVFVPVLSVTCTKRSEFCR
jgi:hypothetical protein